MRPFDVRLPLERAYVRDAMFALELLDAVTLERVAQGVAVTAMGLAGAPIVNTSGLFVWLRESRALFTGIAVDPKAQPFEPLTVPAAEVKDACNTVLLTPRADYPLAPGMTAIRGSLYEQPVARGEKPLAVTGAAITLAWYDPDARDCVAVSVTARTNQHGDFLAILRLPADEAPSADVAGSLKVRLVAQRAGAAARFQEYQLEPGRVTATVLAWSALPDINWSPRRTLP